MLCFWVPFFALTGGRVLDSIPTETGAKNGSKKGDKSGPEVFHESFRMRPRNLYYSVQDGGLLNPKEGEDSLLVVWFKLHRMPRLGRRTILVSKFDVDHPRRPGYAIALFRDANGIRPTIFWQASKQRGRWISFAEMEFLTQHWIMLALSFHENEYLGLHGAIILDQKRPEVQLLGGHQLRALTIPDAKSDFMVGALSDRQFRGQIGAVMVVQRKKLAEELLSIVADIVRAPTVLPAAISKQDLTFWSLDGATDLSKNKLAIVAGDLVAAAD